MIATRYRSRSNEPLIIKAAESDLRKNRPTSVRDLAAIARK
jgi:hypothetical protein